MVLIFFLKIALANIGYSQHFGRAMISFDEGPSKNLEKLLYQAYYVKVPLVFFLDPYAETFNKNVVENILNSGHEVGLGIKEELDEDEQHITRVIRKCVSTFIEKSGYRPVLVRLPSVGIISDKAIQIITKLGYCSSLPTLDSEDDQNPNYPSFLFKALQSLNRYRESVSIVFRDRMSQSVNLFRQVVSTLRYYGFYVVPARDYYGMNTNLKKINEKVFKSIVKRNQNVIEVSIVTEDNGILFDIDVPYSSKNFKRIENLSKGEIVGNKKKEEIIKELKNLEKEGEENADNEDPISEKDSALEDSQEQENIANCNKEICVTDNFTSPPMYSFFYLCMFLLFCFY